MKLQHLIICVLMYLVLTNQEEENQVNNGTFVSINLHNLCCFFCFFFEKMLKVVKIMCHYGNTDLFCDWYFLNCYLYKL